MSLLLLLPSLVWRAQRWKAKLYVSTKHKRGRGRIDEGYQRWWDWIIPKLSHICAPRSDRSLPTRQRNNRQGNKQTHKRRRRKMCPSFVPVTKRWCIFTIWTLCSTGSSRKWIQKWSLESFWLFWCAPVLEIRLSSDECPLRGLLPILRAVQRKMCEITYNVHCSGCSRNDSRQSCTHQGPHNTSSS